MATQKVTQEVRDGLKEIYRKALLDAILFSYHNASVIENDSIKPELINSFEELMESINNLEIE